jgi:hypothetical protein
VLESQILIEEYSPEKDLHNKGPMPLAVALTLRQLPFSSKTVEPDLTNKMYLWRAGQLLKSHDIGRGVLKSDDPDRVVADPVLKPNEVWYQMVRPLNLSNTPLPVLAEELPKPRPRTAPVDAKKELTQTRGTVD